jgi:deoxycytidylate deaminase/aminoglycoside phosphotransferase (APT) family kinase protein
MIESPLLNKVSAEERDRVLAIVDEAMHQQHISSIEAFFTLFGNRNYKVTFKDDTAQPIVVRIYQTTDRYITEREALLSVSANTCIPVPQIITDSSQVSTIRDDFAIMQYIQGGRLQENLLFLTDDGQKEIGQQLGEYLAQLHNLKRESYGNLVAGARSNRNSEVAYTLEIFELLLLGAQTRNILTEDELVRIQGIFDRNKELLSDTTPSLIHGDMIDANILIDEIGGTMKITGVLDFEHSKAWSPEVDFTKILDLRFFDHPVLVKSLKATYFHNVGIANRDAIERFDARLNLFRLISDLQLAVDLAGGSVGFFAKLLISSRHLPFRQYQRLIALLEQQGKLTTPVDQRQEDIRLLRYSVSIAKRSKCKLLQRRGAVIAKGEIVAIGYNEPTNQSCPCITSTDDLNNHNTCDCIPAEMSALLAALRNEQVVRDATLYCTECPSSASLKWIARSGIGRVVFIDGGDKLEEREYLRKLAIRIELVDRNSI